MNIEPLEVRIAPASLNGQVLTYTDIDGDHVTLTISKGTLAPGLFTFDTGSVNGENSVPQQLRAVNLTAAAGADNANILMKVVKAPGGDGLAAVGIINATGKNLGTITIQGDLGDLEAGTGPVGNPAAKAITVRSAGAYGLVTQGGGGNLVWNIQGDVASLKVTGDVKDSQINVFGKLGPLTIGGSIIGGSGTFSGAVGTTGGIGPVKVGHDIRGGTGFGSGLISTDADLVSITLGGSLIGGGGQESGEIRSVGNMGLVKIAGDVRGGTGSLSGRIDTFGNLAGLMLGGSFVGGKGDQSFTSSMIFHEGQIFAVGNIGPVKIARDMIGGPGFGSAEIRSHGATVSVTVGGSLFGGDGIASAQIATEGTLGPVTIGGSVVGGAGAFSGILHGTNVITSIKVGGSFVGVAAGTGGYVEGDSAIGNITIGGSIVGSGISSGYLIALGSMGTVKIGGSIQGGTGNSSGFISAAGSIASLTIGGSLAGGTGQSTTGTILSSGDIGVIKIGRDLVGGSLASAASIGMDSSGYIQSTGRIKSVSIGGSVVSGIDQSSSFQLTNNASIRAGQDIGSLMVKGNLIGNTTTNGSSPVVVSALHVAAPTATSNLAIGKIQIGGRVEQAQIFAGYNSLLAATDGSAQIGPVTVGGDWLASILVAGVRDVNADGFGNGDDAIIGGGVSIAKIASITIKGTVAGSTAAGDRFGFVSHNIGSFKAQGSAAMLTGGLDVVGFAPLTADVFLREV